MKDRWLAPLGKHHFIGYIAFAALDYRHELRLKGGLGPQNPQKWPFLAFGTPKMAKIGQKWPFFSYKALGLRSQKTLYNVYVSIPKGPF